MAQITNMRGMSRADLERHVKTMHDGELQAQELVQKGAMHALTQLKLNGISAANVEDMLRSLSSMAVIISIEVRKRGLLSIDHPAGS